MKRFLILALLLTITSFLQAQDVDTATIAFKAKLMTVSRFGIVNTDTLLKDILNQEHKFLESPSSNLYLIQINFSQKYYRGNRDRQTLWLGDCSYYIAFNVGQSKFYRLGGFDHLDLEEFFNDLEPSDLTLFSPEFTSDIDFQCLRAYAAMSARKRIKKSPCLSKCSDEMYTTTVVH